MMQCQSRTFCSLLCSNLAGLIAQLTKTGGNIECGHGRLNIAAGNLQGFVRSVHLCPIVKGSESFPPCHVDTGASQLKQSSIVCISILTLSAGEPSKSGGPSTIGSAVSWFVRLVDQMSLVTYFYSFTQIEETAPIF
jgi:hypothetical protein